MKVIELTQGKKSMVDDDDFERINCLKWFAMKLPNTFYAGRNFQTGNGARKTIQMHKIIMGYAPHGMEIDHIDGNGLNNQKSNLRFVTRRQNMQNAVNSKVKRTSRFPGVSYDSRRDKWKAYIKVSGKHIDIGRFDSEDRAFSAYKNYVKSLGENVLSVRE